MTAQKPVEVICGVTCAYTFTVRCRDFAPHTVGVIANSRGEAMDILLSRLLGHWKEGEVSIFGSGFKRLQPAMITRFNPKMVEEKGYYAFLEGIFFARYGDHQVASSCRQEKTSNGWYATIYGHSHSVKPLTD